jgi:hypothetical protein
VGCVIYPATVGHSELRDILRLRDQDRDDNFYEIITTQEVGRQLASMWPDYLSRSMLTTVGYAIAAEMCDNLTGDRVSAQEWAKANNLI